MYFPIALLSHALLLHNNINLLALFTPFSSKSLSLNFQDNVAAFIQTSNHEQTLLKFQEMINKYRFMETHLMQRRGGLESKIPEIKKSLDLVKLLEVAVRCPVARASHSFPYPFSNDLFNHFLNILVIRMAIQRLISKSLILCGLKQISLKHQLSICGWVYVLSLHLPLTISLQRSNALPVYLGQCHVRVPNRRGKAIAGFQTEICNAFSSPSQGRSRVH